MWSVVPISGATDLIDWSGQEIDRSFHILQLATHLLQLPISRYYPTHPAADVKVERLVQSIRRFRPSGSVCHAPPVSLEERVVGTRPGSGNGRGDGSVPVSAGCALPSDLPTTGTGTISGTWRMADAAGAFFGDALTIIIKIGSGGGAQATATTEVSATATSTP